MRRPAPKGAPFFVCLLSSERSDPETDVTPFAGPKVSTIRVRERGETDVTPAPQCSSPDGNEKMRDRLLMSAFGVWLSIPGGARPPVVR